MTVCDFSYLGDGGRRQRLGVHELEHLRDGAAEVALDGVPDGTPRHGGRRVQALLELAHVLLREQRRAAGDELPQFDVRRAQALEQLPQDHLGLVLRAALQELARRLQDRARRLDGPPGARRPRAHGLPQQLLHKALELHGALEARLPRGVPAPPGARPGPGGPGDAGEAPQILPLHPVHRGERRGGARRQGAAVGGRGDQRQGRGGAAGEPGEERREAEGPGHKGKGRGEAQVQKAQGGSRQQPKLRHLQRLGGAVWGGG